MNNYIVLQDIQSYNCYLIICNILFLLFKYLNNKKENLILHIILSINKMFITIINIIQFE